MIKNCHAVERDRNRDTGRYQWRDAGHDREKWGVVIEWRGVVRETFEFYRRETWKVHYLVNRESEER